MNKHSTKKKHTNQLVSGKNKISVKTFSNEQIHQNLYDYVIAIIKKFQWLLLAIFSGLAISGLIDEFIKNRPIFRHDISDLFYKNIIAIYFVSWIFGCIQDVTHEKDAIELEPNEGKLPIAGYAIMIGLVILFCGICIAPNNFWRSISFLALFTFDAIISWNYLKRFIRPSIEERKKNIGTDSYINSYKLSIIEHYLFGPWKKQRIICGGTAIILLNILVISNGIGILSNLIHIRDKYLVIIFIIIYLLIMELWIWYYRIRRKFIFEALEKIKNDPNL